MTDKEKIRTFVERRINELHPAKEKIGIVGGVAVKRHLESILSFIDSMQEEPSTSVWHDASEIPVASKTKIVLYTNGKWDLFKAYEAKGDFDNYWAGVNQSLAEKGVFVKQWSYVDDLLKL